MKNAPSSACLAAALVLGLAGSPGAHACELDGLFGHGFSPSFGTRPPVGLRPQASPLTPPPDFAPRYFEARPAEPVARAVDALTLERIGPRMRALHGLLEAMVVPYGRVSLAVLSLDSGRWTRFARSSPVVEVVADAEKPEPGDVAIRAGEWALGEVLDRRLPLAAAVDSGFVVIDSGTIAADAVRRMLVLSP